MKKRTSSTKTFKYKSGKLKIESDIVLTKRLIIEIKNIIKEVTKYGHYHGCAYNISRRIAYQICNDFCTVEYRFQKGRIFITIVRN